MTKRTLSNKTRSSVLKVSGFRARMATAQGRKIIRNRRKKGRKKTSNSTLIRKFIRVNQFWLL